MREEILQRLQECLLLPNKRTTHLIADFADGYASEWAMCVPACFAAALDIFQTKRVVDKVEKLEWTQGSAFSFTEGDIFYDNRQAYVGKWSDAVQSVSLAVQVDKAVSVLPANIANRGAVSFRIFRPDAARSKLVLERIAKGSQDDFVRFLILGVLGS